MEAEIDQSNVIKQTDCHCDKRVKQRYEEEATRLDGLGSKSKQAYGTACCLRNVAQHNIHQEEDQLFSQNEYRLSYVVAFLCVSPLFAFFSV